MIVICWHVLTENAEYQELGEDCFDTRNDATRRTRRLVVELERLGHQVTITPAA